MPRLVAVLACALCLAACGGSGGGSGEIRFLVFGEPEEINAYRELISAYHERGDDRVQLIEASDREDLLARLSTSFAGGAPPDVFLLNYRFYGQFAARGVLEPLEERVNESEEFEPGDFYPQAMEAFHWDGVLTCLPQNVSSLVVYYNRDLFRRFKVAEPRRGWTWTEFIVRAAQLTRDAQGRQLIAGDPEQGAVTPEIFGLGVEPTIIRVAPFVWSNGGEIVDDNERPTRFTFQTPRALQALEEFLKLRSTYGVVPTDVDVEAEDDETRFQNGRLAMLLSSRRSTPTFRTITAFDWDVADLPRSASRPASSTPTRTAWRRPRARRTRPGASSSSRTAPRASGSWRRPAERSRRSRRWPSQRRSSIPTAKPKSSQVFLDQIETIRRVPTISTWPEIEDATGPILEDGLYKGQDAQQVAGGSTPRRARCSRAPSSPSAPAAETTDASRRRGTLVTLCYLCRTDREAHAHAGSPGRPHLVTECYLGLETPWRSRG